MTVRSRMFVRMAARRRLQELLRIFLKLRETVMAAKIMGLPVVNVLPRGVTRLHFHAANWINHSRNPNSPPYKLSRQAPCTARAGALSSIHETAYVLRQ